MTRNQVTDADYYRIKAAEEKRRADTNLRLAAERATDIDDLKKRIDELKSANDQLQARNAELATENEQLRFTTADEIRDDVALLLDALKEAPGIAPDIVEGFRKMFLQKHQMIMCSHCGHAIDNSDPEAAHAQMIEHLHICEKNPVVVENKQLREALKAGWELSTWAATIHWDGSRNRLVWLDEFRILIEDFQEKYESLGLDGESGGIND